MPPVVSLVGKANSGKTTLLEKLIPVLIAAGLRVGTIKHHVHAFEMDRPGKDTWRHRQAGASVVALSSPTGLGLIRDTGRDLGLAELVGRYFGEVDLVLTEGYKSGPAPKVEVCRAAVQGEPLANRDQTWLAMVSDLPLDCGLPVFGLDDAAGLARFLIDTLLASKHGKPAAEKVARPADHP
jgi:molybdopterin-guanine dinucleotide biosynthesis protein B